MVHWSGVIGKNAESKILELSPGSDFQYSQPSKIHIGKGWALSIQESENPLLPSYPIWSDTEKKLGLFLNGVIYTREFSIDEVIDTPKQCFSKLLNKYADDPKKIVNSFVNGTYSGLIIDSNRNEFHLFLDPFGFMPVYYYFNNETLYFSTELHLLAQNSNINESISLSALNEYLAYGALISSKTLINNVKYLDFASLLSFSDGKISVKKWYSFPKESSCKLPLSKSLHKTYLTWKQSISSLQSKEIDYCLSLTGGMDSRLIFTEWPHKKSLITETGNSKENPDYIFSRELVKSYKVKENHILEPSHDKNFFNEYINYLLLLDNPLLSNTPFPLSHLRWKKEIGVELLMLGSGGENLGGDHLWHSHGVKGLLKELLPFKKIKFKNKKSEIERKGQLLDIIFNYNKERELQKYINSGYKEDYVHNNLREKVAINIDEYIGEVHSEQAYLERIRRAYKDQFFYGYTYLPGRRYHETIYPFFHIDFVNRVFEISVETRSFRKYMFSLLNLYYSKTREIPVTTSFLKQKRHYSLHRIFKPFVKGINLGYKKRIPFLQPRNMKTNSNTSRLLGSNKLLKFIDLVLTSSSMINPNYKEVLDIFLQTSKIWTDKQKIEWENIWRLYSLALAEKRFQFNREDYNKWIIDLSQKAKELVPN